MSVQSNKKTGHSHRWVQANLNELTAFPRRHEGAWRFGELPRGLSGVFAEARDRGLIEKVDTQRYEDQNKGTTYSTYRLTPTLDAMIERFTAFERSTMPCGHSGVKNLPDGDYTCGATHCQQEFPRHIAEEVFQQ